VLLDLWAGCSRDTVFADQTWMAFSGPAAPSAVVRVWEAVRDARDRAVDRLRQGLAAGQRVEGRDLDAAARDVLKERGYGEAFVHRTGHSIDLELHGSGPHLDSFETDDDRELVPGIGFSVEPGVYLTGKFGVRSEINVALLEAGPEVTPRVPQRDLIVPA
jgi:Xaa-Pro aminopeptidase